MGVRIPSNKIIKSKYTIGKEYLLLSTYTEYQGYYYESNNKTFAGKDFNIKNPEIIKITSYKFNPLLSNPDTSIYTRISKTKINSSPPLSIISKSDINAETRYFYKKIDSNPILIKEITKDIFDSVDINPLYQTISISIPEGGFFSNQLSLEEYNKIMPGIKEFLVSERPPD